MLEQQFIQWSETIDPLKKEIPLPVCDSVQLQFFGYMEDPCAHDPAEYNDWYERIDLVRTNGDVIKTGITGGYRADWKEDRGYGWKKLIKLVSYLSPMECFRLRLVGLWIDSDEENADVCILAYSNLLRYVCNEDGYLSSLAYYCNEVQFGFPFSTTPKTMVQVALPILLSAAQYTQTDKIYETRNGEQIVLYATINKEYEGETDYIPEEWHEKIVTALSCDEVYINGERVTKSDSYEIDQDNYTYSDCGIRLTRATFKVKTNVIKRNSNC